MSLCQGSESFLHGFVPGVVGKAGQEEPRAKGLEGSRVSPRLRAQGFAPEQVTPVPYQCPGHVGASRHQGPPAVGPGGLEEAVHGALRMCPSLLENVEALL